MNNWELLIFAALLIFGVHAITRPRKILGFMGIYINVERGVGTSGKNIDELEAIAARKRKYFWVIEPFAPALTECLTCMSSFWGILVLLMDRFDFLQYTLIGIPIWWLFFPVLLAGLNFIIANIANPKNSDF